MKSEGEKVIHVRVKAILHDTLKRMCVETGMTQTQIISQYLTYLRRKQHCPKWVLGGHTENDKFQLDPYFR